MTIADKLALLEQTKETQRVKLGLPESIPFSRYHEFFQFKFVPSYLFLNGEQGAWLDPSDLKTMFQDVQGSNPVTKDGDPVALIKDKSGNGNHTTQKTATARPIYRIGDGRGVVNLVLNSDKQAGLGWGGGRSIEYDTSDIPPPPELRTVNKVTATAGNTGISSQPIPVEAGKSYTVSLWVAKPEGSNANIRFRATGPVEVYQQNNSINGDGIFYRVNATYKCLTSGNATFGIDGLHASHNPPYIYYGGLQVEEGAEVTEYQRNIDHLGGVGTGRETDVYWLAFDGVDDTLNVLLPTGTYTEIKASRDGVTHKYPVNVNGSYALGDLTQTKQSVSGLVLVNRQLTQAEIANVTNLMKVKAGLPL